MIASKIRNALALVACLGLVLGLAGCGEDGVPGKDEAMKWVEKAMSSGADLKAKLAGITDGKTAEAAKGALTPLVTAFAGAKSSLGNLPSAVTDLLGDKFTAFKDLSSGLKGQAASLMEKADVKKVLGDLLGKLQ